MTVTQPTVAWAFCMLVVVGLLATYWATYDAPSFADAEPSDAALAPACSRPLAMPVVHSALTP